VEKLNVFTPEQTTALKSAFNKHTASLATGASVGNLVRKTLQDANITAFELLPESNELFSGRAEVRPMLLGFINDSLPASVKQLIGAKPSDCNDLFCFLWSERTNKQREIISVAVRTDDQKKLGFKTLKEHRRDWTQQANSRLNDYRSSLARLTGAILKKPTSDASDATDEKSDKVNAIEQGSKNLSHSIENCESSDVALSRITKRDFNDLARILNKLMGLTEPTH
jgi:hypothetical protein